MKYINKNYSVYVYTPKCTPFGMRATAYAVKPFITFIYICRPEYSINRLSGQKKPASRRVLDNS
jgi:hypothetical protein